MNNSSGRQHTWLVICLLIGIAFRVVHLILFKNSPFFRTPIVDELYHHLWAQMIANGQMITKAVFFRAPLYPYFLGLIYAIFGENPFIPRIVQHIFGVLSIFLTWKIALEIFNNKKIAFTAGLLFAIYPITILFESRLLLDSLPVFLNLLFILLLILGVKRDKFIFFILSGAALGFSAITRPNVLITIPFICLWAYFALNSSPFSRIKKLAVFLWGIGLIVLPITIFNFWAENDFVLVSSQGGINFYIGNNERADGTSAIVPEFGHRWEYKECKYLAEQETGNELKPSQVSKFFFRKGISFLKSKPSEALSLYLRKIYFLFNHYEIGNNGNLYFIKSYSPILNIPIGFWLICPLGLLGMILSIRRKHSLLLTIFFTLYSISVLLFFVIARLRLPLVPILVIFSSFSIFEIYAFISQKRWGKLVLSSTILAVLFVLINLNFLNISTSDPAYSHFQLGNVSLRQGYYERAMDEYSEALKLYPGIPDAHLNMGSILFEQKKYESAIKEFNSEIEVNPTNAEAYANLGVIYRILSDTIHALEFGEKAIEARPSFVEGYLNYALTLSRIGKVDRGLTLIEKALKISPNDKRLLLTAGALAEKTGNSTGAVGYYERGLRKDNISFVRNYDMGNIYEEQGKLAAPDSIIDSYLYYNLGSILGKKGDLYIAQKYILRAVELNPNLIDAHLQLGTVLDRLGEYQAAYEEFKYVYDQGFSTAELHFNMGLALAKMGRLEEAELEFEKALDLSSENETIKKQLEIIKKLE
ncbi:tetratricopeptide repeat protein [bacterium]|nr:tetratricopeptide repeat protein [bacterium]